MPRIEYIRHYNRPSLVQIMTYRLPGTTPLSEPMLPFFNLNYLEHISIKLWMKIKKLFIKKIDLRMSPAEWLSFCFRLNVQIVILKYHLWKGIKLSSKKYLNCWWTVRNTIPLHQRVPTAQYLQSLFWIQFQSSQDALPTAKQDTKRLSQGVILMFSKTCNTLRVGISKCFA